MVWKKLLVLIFVSLLFSISSVSAANLICGTGSSGTCPTVGNECSGNTGVCNYTTCSCAVSSTQGIDSNGTYYFYNFTILSGVTLNIYTQARCVGTGSAGGNGPGGPYGGTGGIGGDGGYAGGSYAGGGGAGGGYIFGPATGGSYSGAGGGGGTQGGNGGGRFNLNASFINIFGTLNANGGDVTGGQAEYTGGGGGGGGQVFLYGNYINISGGTITANGRAGGAANNYGGGGGGGGGYIQITYSSTYSAGTYSVTYGSGGSGGGGNGAAGSSGSIQATPITTSSTTTTSTTTTPTSISEFNMSFWPVNFFVDVKNIASTSVGDVASIPVYVQNMGILAGNFTMNATPISFPEYISIENNLLTTSELQTNKFENVYLRVTVLAKPSVNPQIGIWIYSNVDKYSCSSAADCNTVQDAERNTTCEVVSHKCAVYRVVEVSSGLKSMPEIGLLGVMQIFFIASLIALITFK